MRFYIKKLFLKIHTFYRKTPVPEAWNVFKKVALAQMFYCEICETFKNTFFIQHLQMTASGTKQTSEFINKISNRKKISNEYFNLCKTEISLDGIIKSVNFETNNKSPGNDDLTREFYKHFLNELAPFLLESYDSSGKLGTRGVTSRTGILSVK